MVEPLGRNGLQTLCKLKRDRVAHLKGGREIELIKLPGNRIGDFLVAVSGIAAPKTRGAVQDAAIVVAAAEESARLLAIANADATKEVLMASQELAKAARHVALTALRAINATWRSSL